MEVQAWRGIRTLDSSKKNGHNLVTVISRNWYSAIHTIVAGGIALAMFSTDIPSARLHGSYITSGNVERRRSK